MAQINIAEDHKGISEHLLYKWQKLYSEVSNYPSLTIEIDLQTRAQLEALVYVDFQDNASETTKITDGIAVNKDNCPFKTNPEQKDTDGEGQGDVCDNCPLIANAYQEDADEDLIGDTCDLCIDTDWDGYGNPDHPNKCEKDTCPAIFNPLQEDSDEDGKGDACECEADFDCDGSVNTADSTLFSKNFNIRTKL